MDTFDFSLIGSVVLILLIDQVFHFESKHKLYNKINSKIKYYIYVVLGYFILIRILVILGITNDYIYSFLLAVALYFMVPPK